ncbi:hypothetical protein PUN28_019733 [Cardiocondyla obscurior]|uniref:Uncharacterized protein n=1 Tax=Cardiocondyla obscurior TaxID=286306 RepID=A0AAW2E6G2_9HYME
MSPGSNATLGGLVKRGGYNRRAHSAQGRNSSGGSLGLGGGPTIRGASRISGCPGGKISTFRILGRSELVVLSGDPSAIGFRLVLPRRVFLGFGGPAGKSTGASAFASINPPPFAGVASSMESYPQLNSKGTSR